MENLEKAANKWLKPYPNAAWRENVEVLLVALAVAMGIRTFFLQPFKIPTGSMQPTLFGVTSENLINKPDFKIPTGLTRVREWFAGRLLRPPGGRKRRPAGDGRAPVPHSHLQHLAESRGRRQDLHDLVSAGLWRAAAGTLEARAGLQLGPVLPQGRGHRQTPGQRRRPSVC